MSSRKPVMRRRAVRAPRRPWWAPYVCAASVFWLMLWAGSNTGSWVFYEQPESLQDLIHFVRAAFPPIVLIAAFVVASSRRSRVTLPGSLRLWACYGALGFAASFMSPKPLDAAYWGASYLSVFVAVLAYLRRGHTMQRAVELNYLTWVIVTVIVCILCVIARDVLRDAADTDWSAYTVMQRMGGSVGGVAVPRSTGMARFAAVPAIVAYVMLWRERKWGRWSFWAALFAGSCALIYMMQARGTTFALVFALAAATYCLGIHVRVVGLVAVLAGALTVVHLVPSELTDRVFEHVLREEAIEELSDMSGRTDFWARGWERIIESPVLGRGFRADRFLGIGEIHNASLYVLLTAGFVGLTLFGAGLVWAWADAAAALRRGIVATVGHTAMVAQTVGILAFFTLRSIPEGSIAYFSVDLLVTLPAIAYLGRVSRFISPSRNAVGTVAPPRDGRAFASLISHACRCRPY